MPLKFKMGDCEASHFNGGGINVKIFPAHHDLWLCQECLDEENAAIERTTKVVEHARKIDTLVELKQDLFTAGTIPFVEISAAVHANPSIPDSEKTIKILDEIDLRIKTLSAAIFSEKAETLRKENERYALQINAQKLAATLHEKDKEKYKHLDVNYHPQVKKTPKSQSVPINSFSKKEQSELYETAKKYNLSVSLLRSTKITQSNKSYDEVAKKLAESMGLI